MPPNPPVPSVEDEVLANIRQQPLGPGTLNDLALPVHFLRRVADRIIRSSFEERYRIVVPSTPGGPAADPPPPTTDTASPAPGPAEHPRIIGRPPLPAQILIPPEARPALRGYRAPVLGSPDPWPSDLPSDPAPARAADVIARRLAADGLLPTLAVAIESIGPDHASADLLRSAGFPTDLLDHFQAPGDAPALDFLVAQIRAGAAPSSLRRAIAAISFRFRASCPGFQAFSESGEGRIRAVRLQLTGGAHWGGHGAGGGLDVAQRLLRSLPDADFIASIQADHLPEFLASASRWERSSLSRLRIIPEPLPVSQWAQDNAKPGQAAPGQWATLVPRYASRGEDGSILIPGETLLADGLAAAGLSVIQSPLLFQGGNLMLARAPDGERILLIGEAEVYRNTALGLTEAQAIEAFRIEFGADRCAVLPAVSFHIDYEVTVRSVRGRLLAFVNDSAAAVSIILACGLPALVRAGALAASAADAARARIAARRWPEFMSAVAEAVAASATGPGRFPEHFADAFSTGPADSGVANLQRFLLATDMMTASLASPDALPDDRHARAYLRSFGRREADRRILHRRLEALGCRLVPIPSLGEGERGMNALNGIHDAGRYLMPTYGGLYTPLDEAAASAFRRDLGPETAIVPIPCGESQRRSGAVRCAAAVYTAS